MRTFLFLSAIILTATSCTTGKRHYGNYYNKWRYWGAMYVLKPDGSFDYTYRNNIGPVTRTEETTDGTYTFDYSSYIFSDTSYGTYILHGDTVYLTYLTDMAKGNFNGYNIRPEKLFWQGKKLFYISANGQAIRQKEYYMQLRKDTIANLYRQDENGLHQSEQVHAPGRCAIGAQHCYISFLSVCYSTYLHVPILKPIAVWPEL